MQKSEKYARYFRQMRKPANRVTVYGLRVLFFFFAVKGRVTISVCFRP